MQNFITKKKDTKEYLFIYFMQNIKVKRTMDRFYASAWRGNALS